MVMVPVPVIVPVDPPNPPMVADVSHQAAVNHNIGGDVRDALKRQRLTIVDRHGAARGAAGSAKLDVRRAVYRDRAGDRVGAAIDPDNAAAANRQLAGDKRAGRRSQNSQQTGTGKPQQRTDAQTAGGQVRTADERNITDVVPYWLTWNCPLTAILPIRMVLADDPMVSEAAAPGPVMIWLVQAASASVMVTALLEPGAAPAVPPAVVSDQLLALLQAPPVVLVQL